MTFKNTGLAFSVIARFGADVTAVGRGDDQCGARDDKDGPRSCEQARYTRNDEGTVDVSLVQFLSGSHKFSVRCLFGCKVIFFDEPTLIVMDIMRSFRSLWMVG